MSHRRTSLGFMVGAAVIAAAEIATIAAIGIASIQPAQAQLFGEPQRRRGGGGGGGFFDQLFGPRGGGPSYGPGGGFGPDSEQGPVESTRPPAAPKRDTPPETSIMVMGDSMAEWLAYGLEETFADTPEVGIVRKDKNRSGLLRYDARTDQDWWHVAKDILGQEKADYVVMMLGVYDRQAIREPAPKRGAKKEDAKKEESKKEDAAKKQDNTDAEAGDDTTIAAPEPDKGKSGPAEFRSERWAETYGKRVDETIAALRTKGVPVFWVGLPPIRGTKSTSEAQYLNDLFRARAEKAGAIYIDVWDGFVDEGGKYSNFGPDLEGQNRRLRSGDGVHFTKYGARKLAHYVERELRRYMQNRSLPMAMPSPGGAMPQQPGEAVRPAAGPVVPLTVVPSNSNELLGGGPGQPGGDAVASRVLVKGEALSSSPGRADDFAWPRGAAAPANTPTPAPVSIPAEAPPVAAKPATPVRPGAKPAPTAQQAKPRTANAQQQQPSQQQRPAQAQPPRPAAPVQAQRQGASPFGWFR